jgi:hypothetical protein
LFQTCTSAERRTSLPDKVLNRMLFLVDANPDEQADNQHDMENTARAPAKSERAEAYTYILWPPALSTYGSLVHRSLSSSTCHRAAAAAIVGPI